MMGVILLIYCELLQYSLNNNTNKNKFRKPIETPVLHKYFL